MLRAVQNQSRLKRLLNKDDNDAALSREREMLLKAVTVFQVSSRSSDSSRLTKLHMQIQEGLAMRYSMAKLDRDIRSHFPITVESQPLSGLDRLIMIPTSARSHIFFWHYLSAERSCIMSQLFHRRSYHICALNI